MLRAGEKSASLGAARLGARHVRWALPPALVGLLPSSSHRLPVPSGCSPGPTGLRDGRPLPGALCLECPASRLGLPGLRP